MNDEGIRQHIETLKIEHRDLDDAIMALQANPVADQLQIARLKRRKLALKDRVIFTHELNDGKGHSYTYTKTVRLQKGKPELTLEHSLKNTGQKTLLQVSHAMDSDYAINLTRNNRPL